MFKIYRFLKDYKKEVILGPLFKIVEAIFELIVPLVMAKIIDVGIKNNDINYIIKMGLILILLAVIGLLSTLVCQYYACVCAVGFSSKLRSSLYNHINSLGYEELDKISSQSLINRMTNDVNQLQLSVAMLIRLVIRAPFLVIGATIMAILIAPFISFIFIIVGVLIALSLYFVMSRSIPHFKRTQKELDNVSVVVKENLSGGRVVRAFSKQEDEFQRFKLKNNNLYNSSVKSNVISSLLNPLTYVIVNFGIILVIYFGSIKVNTNQLTQGEVLALINYLMQILLALIVVANLVIIFTKASSSASRVNEVFDLKPSKKNVLNNTLENTSYIEFKDVYFSYNENKNTLENINFKINKNDLVGIIGVTGSGKSTLLSLLCNFYKPTSGNIYFKGKNLNSYTEEEINKLISIVPQKSVLFKDSVLNNLRIRKRDASIEEVTQAIKISQADFILKLGLDYEIESYSKNLSGGQNQRLVIARSLVGEFEVIIFDDSTSALDFKTEALLLKSVKENLKDKTKIFITQRIETVKESNLILLVDDGVIVGSGKHEDLLKTNTLYQNLYYSQNKEEAL